MTHKEYADGLRAIADFFERHEEIELPHDHQTFDYFAAYGREEMAAVAIALGSCDKEFGEQFGDSFALTKQFGAITFRAITDREQVCRRVVKGKKEIPGYVVPAQPESYVPAKEEEIVEWECEPLLADKFDKA